MGVRGKLFLVSLGLMLLLGGAAGLYLEQGLRRWLEGQVEADLLRAARSTRETLALAAGAGDIDLVDRVADRLGGATGSRVTIIDGDGRVLGDSELSPAEVARVDNHAGRPEVTEALAAALPGGVGVARRHSTTVATDMLYVAVPFEGPGGRGVIRAATPLGVVDEAVGRLRLFLSVAALLGLGIATGMSWLASHLLSRALRRLVGRARDLVAGEERRIDIRSSDEIGRLAGSFNRMAEELQGAMATLASERSRFEAVLQSMSEAVLALDEAQRITLVNNATLTLLGLEERPIDRPLLEVLEIPAVGELAAAARSGPASTEFSITAGEPAPRRVLARATPLAASGGTVIVMHDVTEMRRLETIRKDFVANVSHELRTPVSIIRANAETLLDGALEDPPRARSFVEALHRNSERLSRIIADLLDLSRIEAGRYKLEVRPLEVLEAVEHAVEIMEPRILDRRLSLEVFVPEALEVRADAKALDQILVNLLDNAVKYTPEGGRVRISAEREGGEVWIGVEDSGPGIPPEHRERVFERFYRVDPGRSRDMGGTGLGLAIVKHFVESMRGSVGVASAEPRGSVFWLTLPAAEVAEAA